MSDDDVTPVEVPVICRCGRTRCTKADLARWFEEKEASTEPIFNPDWAKKICWTKRSYTECNMKPLQETPS